MTVMRLLAALALLAVPALAEARTKGPTLCDKQQAACYGDVQRFCADAVPNVAKVTACMATKKEVVSAPCRAMWDVK